jgi:Domain of unknown function (DUF4258)
MSMSYEVLAMSAEFSLNQAILTGEILERQKDRDTDEWKYIICGFSMDGDPIEVVAKLGVSGKVVIITVYAL